MSPDDGRDATMTQQQPSDAAHALHDRNGLTQGEHEARDRQQIAAVLARKTPIWKPVLFLTLLAVAAGVLVAVGVVPIAGRKREVAATSEALHALARRVTFVSVKQAAPVRTLTLPASLLPNATADLFAQATGYVRERKADIGDHVAAGDVLAVLDVPLVDEQLNSARAALSEAVAAKEVLARNLALAESTLARWKAVEPPGAVSQQELAERQSGFEAARASLAAGEAAITSRRADVQRFEHGQAFSRIIAPFAGKVVARDVELGDYVSGAGAGRALFRIADTSTLRAFIDVPQSFAPGIVVDGVARVTVREKPGSVFQGKIARTSGALDARTRTMRVEVTLPNEDGALLAGSYGQVELDVARSAPVAIVPGSALILRAEGARIAYVDAGNHLRYTAVHVDRDLGSEVEISEGLVGDERVVVNMADELPEGSVVDPVPLPVLTPPTAPGSAPEPAKVARPAGTSADKPRGDGK
jgi:RND family efflux transporter MFP subunit